MTAKTAKPFTIASNATVAKVVDAERNTLIDIAEMLSYHTDADQGNTFGRRQGWDSKKSFFSFKTKTFPAGFARNIVGRLLKKGYKVSWVKRDLPAPLGDERPIVDDLGYDDPKYSYQPETADKLVRYGQMIANVATGGGKSRIARICYKRISRKTLFITSRSVLMYQMKDDFEGLLGERVGVIGDGEWSPSEGFNVGMVQTLSQSLEKKDFDSEMERAVELEEDALVKKVDAYKRKLRKDSSLSPKKVMLLIKRYRDTLIKERPSDNQLIERIKASVERHNERRKKVLEFMKSVEFLILEEAHEAGSSEYYDVCMAASNAYYRLSLTATAFMRSDSEANMRLMAVSGPIGIRVTEKYLIESGVLATPKFYFINTAKPKKLYRTTSWTQAYKIGVTDHDWRNNQVIQGCKLASDYGLTSMTLVLRKEHGKKLEKQLKTAGLRAKFIDGDSSKEQRRDALNKLGKHQIDVLIGTTILDVGVDVPSVGVIFLAGGGKAEIATRQRIGRGLRRKKSGPNICFVVDFRDRYNEHLTKHSVAREKIIRDTPGFGENVIEEFNPEEFGFKRIANSA